MKNFISHFLFLLAAPFYLTALLTGALLAYLGLLGGDTLANWSAHKLRLQGRGPGNVGPTLGADGLIGALADVIEDFSPTVLSNVSKGKVRIKGEIWAATALSGSVPLRGTSVKVIRQEALCLVVAPLDELKSL